MPCSYPSAPKGSSSSVLGAVLDPQVQYQVLAAVLREEVEKLCFLMSQSTTSSIETLGPDGKPRNSKRAIVPASATALARPEVGKPGPYLPSSTSGQTGVSSYKRCRMKALNPKVRIHSPVTPGEQCRTVLESDAGRGMTGETT